MLNPGESGAVPLPSQSWLAKTKQAWEAFWSSEVAAVATLEDEAAIVRLHDLRDQHERYLRIVRRTPFVDSAQGPKPNPAMKDVISIERAIVALEDRFGLSPKARAQLGIAWGQAQLTAADLSRMAANDGDNDQALLAEWRQETTKGTINDD